MRQLFMTRPESARCRRLQLVAKWIAIAVLASDAAWGATLTWSPNTEPDLAGYRIYQCTNQPCGRAYGTASLLTTLSTVNSFDIGTPSATRYYVVTAHDTANNESAESGVAIYTPPTSPPPAPVVPPPTPTGLQFSSQQ